MTIITTDVITVTVQGITGEIEAKIDTGAHQTSMHADDISVNGDDVVFKLNGRTYRAPLEQEQDVSSSDGGTQSRPVIRTSIEIEGQTIDTLVNLNDRSEMPQKLLIGQDVIRSAGLTLQFSEEPSEDDSQSAPTDDVQQTNNDAGDGGLNGSLELSEPLPAAAPTSGTNVELIKAVLKLSVGLNAVQQELVAIMNIINKGSAGKNE